MDRTKDFAKELLPLGIQKQPTSIKPNEAKKLVLVLFGD